MINDSKTTIFMEPEEYEAYLKEQEKMIADIKAKNEALKEAHPKGLASVTLYELNQNIINTLPPLDGDGESKALDNFLKWFSQNEHIIENYYMLLCNQLKYYTVFHLNTKDIENFWKELLDICKECGTIKTMEIDTNGIWAIWLDWQNEGECHCFYLFPYDRGVVEI